VATEHPELAWSFVKDNYHALSDKLGASLAGFFLSSLMGNFNDRSMRKGDQGIQAADRCPRRPCRSERIAERSPPNADFVDRQLPAIDDWIAGRQAGP